MVRTKKTALFDGLELKEAAFKNKDLPTHFHETYSIGIIKEGFENLTIKDRKSIATPKAVIIIDQQELHSNCFYNNEAWTYQTININVDVLNYFFEQLKPTTQREINFLNLIEDDRLYNLILNFDKSSDLHLPIEKILRHLLLHYIVDQGQNRPGYLSWSPIIAEVKEYMGSHLNEKIRVGLIAKKYRRSSFQLIRAFEGHTGLTPVAYLTLIRLNKAKELLDEGNSLVDTALGCGFFDQSHFGRYFKKYIGVSPKEYCQSLITL